MDRYVTASMVQCHWAFYANGSLCYSICDLHMGSPTAGQLGCAAGDRRSMAECGLQFYEDIIKGRYIDVNVGVSALFGSEGSIVNMSWQEEASKVLLFRTLQRCAYSLRVQTCQWEPSVAWTAVHAVIDVSAATGVQRTAGQYSSHQARERDSF